MLRIPSLLPTPAIFWQPAFGEEKPAPPTSEPSDGDLVAMVTVAVETGNLGPIFLWIPEASPEERKALDRILGRKIDFEKPGRKGTFSRKVMPVLAAYFRRHAQDVTPMIHTGLALAYYQGTLDAGKNAPVIESEWLNFFSRCAEGGKRLWKALSNPTKKR